MFSPIVRAAGTLFPGLPVVFHLPRDEPETGIAPACSRQTSLPAGWLWTYYGNLTAAGSAGL